GRLRRESGHALRLRGGGTRPARAFARPSPHCVEERGELCLVVPVEAQSFPATHRGLANRVTMLRCPVQRGDYRFHLRRIAHQRISWLDERLPPVRQITHERRDAT